MMDLYATVFDRISANPIAFIAALWVWIPVTMGLFMTMKLVSDDEIDILTGLFLFVLFFFIGIYVTMAADPRITPWVSLAATLGIIAWPLIWVLTGTNDTESVPVHMLKRAYDALGQQPRNTIFRYRLAEAAAEAELYWHAIAIANNALSGQSMSQFRDEIQAIKIWTKLANERSFMVKREISCGSCNTMIAPGPEYCPNCGGMYLLEAKQPMRRLGKRLGAWIVWFGVAMAVVVMIPAVAASPALSTELRIISIVGLLIVGIFLITKLAVKTRPSAKSP